MLLIHILKKLQQIAKQTGDSGCLKTNFSAMLSNELLSSIEDCTEQLISRNLTISFAESATAGFLAYSFSQARNAGKTLKGSLVCYDACLKEDILKIPKALIEEYTPESAEVTREMALKLLDIIDCDITVAVTGLTKPGGSESPGKPVGTMFYCILYKGVVTERKKTFTGSPQEIINYTIEQIIQTILDLIDDDKVE